MPKIPKQILGSIIYLYDSREIAVAGEDFGGTGFLVGFASELMPDKRHYYAVTNWHVAVDSGASVIRINTRDGGVEIFEFDPVQWFFDPRYDIAVLPIDTGEIDDKKHEVTLIANEMFVTEQLLDLAKLGPGEDVFMVGRFIDHDGKETNRPAVRFGNISVMPSPIKQLNGKMADSYCIDCHSRTGFSGSPVFVYRMPGYDLDDITAPDTPFPQRRVLMAGRNFLGLLGIHWGQFPEDLEIGDVKINQEIAAKNSLIIEGKYIKGFSGMTCVLPAWNILEVLDMPALKEARLKQDLNWRSDEATNST